MLDIVFSVEYDSIDTVSIEKAFQQLPLMKEN
jgi:hypothetical protein